MGEGGEKQLKTASSMKKQKVTSGEREVSAINWRLLTVLAAVAVPLLVGGYWALDTYLLKPEMQYIIEPYSSPTPGAPAALPPTFTALAPAAPPTPLQVAEAPRAGSAPISPLNAPALQPLTMLNGLSSPVGAVAYSADGRWLAAGGLDGGVRVWDTLSGSEHVRFQSASNRVDSLTFRTDGVLLAVAGQDNIVRLFDVATGSELSPLLGPSGAVTAVAFSPRTSVLAAASDDGNVYLWDTSRNERIGTLAGHTSYVTDVAFSGDGSMLASASEDDTVRLWKVPAGTVLAVLEHPANASAIVFQPGGAQLASAAGSVIRLWDVGARTVSAQLTAHSGSVTDLAYSPDGQVLASASADLDNDTVRLWDAGAGRELIALRPPDRVNALAFSPDGRTLAAGSAAYVGLWGVLGEGGAAAAFPGPTAAPTLTLAPGQEPLDPGYAQSGAEAEAAAPAADQGCVLTARYEDINLRAGPDASYERVGTLAQGATDTAEGWATGPDGYTWWRLSGAGAWVRADLVTFPDVCFTLPPIRSN